MVQHRCDLCKRDFTHARALKMHIEMSSVHAIKSGNANYPTRMAPKIQAAGHVVSSGSSIVMPPNRHEPSNQVVTCRTCNRQFENEKALSIHVQNSTGHDNERERGMEDLPYRPRRAPYRGPATFNGNYIRERVQPWCSVCDREFYTESGFQKHINTSREHWENLEQDYSRESSVQSRSEVTGPLMSSKSAMHGPVHQQATTNMTSTQLQLPALIEAERDTFGMSNSMSWNSPVDFAPPSMTYMAHESGSQPPRSFPNMSYPYGHPWSDVPFPIHQWVLELLSVNCHTLDRLSLNGYHLRQETKKEIDQLRKCKNCGGWAVTYS